MPTPGQATAGQATFPYKFTPLGYAATVVGTAAGTMTLPAGIRETQVSQVLIYFGSAVNWRDDGVAPATGTSGTVGIPQAATTYLVYDGLPSKFQVIAQAGTATPVSFAYYG